MKLGENSLSCGELNLEGGNLMQSYLKIHPNSVARCLMNQRWHANNGPNCQLDVAIGLPFDGWVVGVAWDGVEILDVELRTSKFN